MVGWGPWWNASWQELWQPVKEQATNKESAGALTGLQAGNITPRASWLCDGKRESVSSYSAAHQPPRLTAVSLTGGSWGQAWSGTWREGFVFWVSNIEFVSCIINCEQNCYLLPLTMISTLGLVANATSGAFQSNSCVDIRIFYVPSYLLRNAGWGDGVGSWQSVRTLEPGNESSCWS